jgi:phage replication O-like protein O
VENPFTSMSQVNPANGDGFRQVPNDVWWALMRASLSGAEIRVAMSVIDRTDGYSLESRSITMSAFQKLTGLSRDSVANAIKQLEANHIIVVSHGRGTTPSEYLFNKHYDTWKMGQLEFPITPVEVQNKRRTSPDLNWILIRGQIQERDDYTCLYCGFRSPPPDEMLIFADHIVPRNMGGKSVPSNLVACCLSCNSKKKDKTIDEFLPFLDQERVRKIILPRLAELASSREKQTASSLTHDTPTDEANRASSQETPTSRVDERGTRRVNKTILNITIKENIYTREYFEKFWRLYPKKLAKGAAEKAFKKLNPDDQLMKTIISAIEKAKRSDQWTEGNGKFIPYPATWLNQTRWEDEYSEVTGDSRKFTQDRGDAATHTTHEQRRRSVPEHLSDVSDLPDL